MERFDLYTADRQRTGRTLERGERTPDGLYRLVIHVCIFGTDERMLIQRRQPFKASWSDLWDLSVGGCAVTGDTSRTAAEREVREELGLELDLAQTRPVLTLCWDHGFDDYYVITKDLDLGTLTLQPEEVQAVRWAEKDEILRMIDDSLFIPYEPGLIELLFTRRTNRNAQSRADWTRVQREPGRA